LAFVPALADEHGLQGPIGVREHHTVTARAIRAIRVVGTGAARIVSTTASPIENEVANASAIGTIRVGVAGAAIHGSTIASLDGGFLEILLDVGDDCQDFVENLGILDIVPQLLDLVCDRGHDFASDHGGGIVISIEP
jgi:hypothetical protein